ncbi:hypothetical protein JTE90_017280 [Oedothorax gibbosus]|uniref:GRIP domain-containing protein n=1 Tax=Oedothorax gibbosus TaxID=931172 RepID=A0AAV6VDT3_9ARAC|nr:hypothetical protein JTE90_017280 [Oedothorax gibbosus]
MEKKSKRELLQFIEEQNQNLVKYKSRLHDIVGSYKHLLKEKENLESSVRILTEANISASDENTVSDDSSQGNAEDSTEKRHDASLQQLKKSLGELTAEKTRIENELRADRKNILQQKEDLENRLSERESNWFDEKEKYETFILELRKKVTTQQYEREKEQQNHVLMLKELQNLLANERVAKERLEELVAEIHEKASNKISERKALEYEKTIEELKNKLTACQSCLRTTENEAKKQSIFFQKFKEEMNEMQLQYLKKIDEEKKRANMAEEELKLLTFVKEKRISNLESRISELSTLVGDHDKIRQQNQLVIQKLKAKVTQRQGDYAAYGQMNNDEANFWDINNSQNSSLGDYNSSISMSQDVPHSEMEKECVSEKLHAHCQAEIIRLKEEVEQYKLKAESALKDRYNKNSAALLLDAKSGKEIKELKSRITQLHDQLQTCKSQLKLNEEYHNKITTNLEKSCEDLKIQHKQELAQIELSHRAQLLELEHQIQKQRERTLSLLEEKDKEIALLKSSFLTPFVKKDTIQRTAILQDEKEDSPGPNSEETTATLLPSSLISSQKDGHILHYIQELSRKDIEISNLRQARIQSESALRKLQQAMAVIEDDYTQEVESLKSKVKLLESSQDEEGTNVEYLKNVVLGFLKCSDPGSRRHMVNAIATVLHFTSGEVQAIKEYIK